MPNLDRIRAVKAQAGKRLLAIPGVHSIAVGAKIIAGKKTKQPAIAVFVEKKKPASQLTPEEVIPSEIDGVKTDVIEEPPPRLLAGFPDQEQYDTLDGGIQIQAGTSVTGLGTLGCIARTDEPVPKIVALTCHHVVALWDEVDFELKAYTSPDKQKVILWGANVPGVRIRTNVTVKPTGPGSPTFLGPFDYVTTAADTPVTIAASVGALIVAAANPNITIATTTTPTIGGEGGEIDINGVGAFTGELQCEVDPLWVTLTGTKVATMSGIVRGGFLVVVHIVLVPIPSGDFQYIDIFYTTTAGDTLNSIATHVAAEINSLANPGVTAAGPAAPGGSEVTITSGANVVAAIDSAAVFTPMIGDKDSKLRAIASAGVITLTGRVASDDYGIYTNIDLGGSTHSYGLFLNPGKDTPLSNIANTIAGNLNADHIPGVSATASGATITVAGAETVRCFVSSDIRVGQPANNFGSSCCHCCNRRFGRIRDARLELDVAVIEIDAGKKYVAEIKDIGLVTGTHAIDDNDVMVPDSYAVKKRGRTTGVKNGTVEYLNSEGNIPSAGGVFHRYYNDAIKIKGNDFSAGGDSGSAVLNSANEVVGILFGGNNIYTYATPIQTIANELEVIVETATNNNPVTVPASNAHAMAMQPEAQADMIQQFDWDRLRQAELEIAATAQGNELVDTIRKHVPETQTLIRTNNRFAATWRRYGGPLIVQAVLRMAQTRDQTLPATIKGRPLLTSLRKIKEVLDRCGSSELRDDLERYQRKIEASLSLTFPELVASLRVSEQE